MPGDCCLLFSVIAKSEATKQFTMGLELPNLVFVDCRSRLRFLRNDR